MSEYSALGISLRIEAGAHNAPIEFIAATSDGRRVITGGQDKSVRVWSVASRALERTLLWQIGPGRFGELSGMILHPDNKTLFIITRNVEGNAKTERMLTCSLRIFDIETGDLKASHSELGWITDACLVLDGQVLLTLDHLAGLVRGFDMSALEGDRPPAPFLTSNPIPGNPHRMAAWTADGVVRLVTCAWGGEGGLTLHEMSGSADSLVAIKRVAPAASLYPEAIVCNGRRFVAAYWKPSLLAVFDQNLNPVGGPVPLENEPGSLAIFGNSHIVVGAEQAWTTATVKVFDIERSPKLTSAFAGHAGGAKAVACLPDGTVVSAGGLENDIRFWKPSGPVGEPVATIVGGGRTIFATGMSTDLRLGLGYRARHVDDANDASPIDTVFDLKTMTVSCLPIGEDEVFARAVVARNEQTLKLIRDGLATLFVTPPLAPVMDVRDEPFYYAETFGFTPRGDIITGDEYGSVRHIRIKAGRPQFPSRLLRGHQARVWDHAAHGDWLVTGGEDQIARLWYLPDVESGDGLPLAPALSLFVAANGEWVMWSASNFFDSSQDGDGFLGFHVNQGEAQQAQFLSVDRFVRLLYRPGVIRGILETGSESRALTALGIAVPDLAASMPPIVECHDPGAFRSDEGIVHLTVEVRPGGGPIRRVWALRNEKMVWEDQGLKFGAHLYQPISLQLEPGENRFKILAEGNGAKSNPVYIVVNPADGSGAEHRTSGGVQPVNVFPVGETGFAPNTRGDPDGTSLLPPEAWKPPVRVRRMSVELDLKKGAAPGLTIKVTRNGKVIRNAVTMRKEKVAVSVSVPAGESDIAISAGQRADMRQVFTARTKTGALAGQERAQQAGILSETSEPATQSKPRAPAPGAPLTPTKPNLYLLAVGVSRIKNPSGVYKDLKFAAADAVALTKALKSQQGPLFEKVVVCELLDEKATLAGIRAALAKIDGAVRARDQQKQKAGEFARDVTVVFLAGHGLQTSDDRFYFWNHDFDLRDKEGTGLSFLDLGNLITAFPTELLLLIDACHAGMAGAAGIANIRPEELFKRLVDINERAQTIFSATQKSELAIEHAPFGHGLFTQGILRTFNANKAGSEVSVLQLVDATMNAVRIWSSSKQIPSVRVYGDLFRWIVYRS